MAWRPPRSPRRIWLWILLGVLVLLTAGRLAAPAIVAKVVRSSLAELKEGYGGDLRDVELSVLSAQVALLGMRIEKRNGRVPVPFMDIERFVLAAVWEGYKPRMELVAIGAKVNLVDAESEAAQQWGPPFDLEDLRRQLPLELSALRFVDGALHFHNFEAKPKVDLFVRNLDADWEKLTGCLPPGWAACSSTLRGRGAAMRGGSLMLRGRFDRHQGPNFYASATLKELKPVQFNPMLTKYVEIDAQGGTVEADVVYHNRNDAQRLVLVPRLYEVKVVGSDDRDEIRPGRELLAGIAAGYFERRRGTKAIEYQKPAHGKGKWRLIDWSDPRTARAAPP
jgi:Domain of Unknown Function (DUF748)